MRWSRLWPIAAVVVVVLAFAMVTRLGRGGPAAAVVATPNQAQLNVPGGTSATTAASSSVASATSAARVEPKGRVVYAWYTTISPVWLDPQEAQPQITPFNYAYAMHDALVKHLPGKRFAPSLAESYEIAPDYKSAVFKLRQGIKFHDGSPVTAEDVKFTFEKYRGTNATILHEKTEAVEAVDDRTVRFRFKEPFLDFLILYGSPASGAGWVVPKAYYEKVGPNGFKQKPIGAGPYKFVRQTPGTEIELEAFTEYWRKTPNVKTLVIKGVPEAATRVAMLQTGEADFIGFVTGDLLDTVKRNPKLQLVPSKSGSDWIEFFPLDKPDSPFKDVRVRQAVSLALDRKAINEAEFAGLSPIEGNWIPEDYPGTLQRPVPPYDLAKAKQLLAEAGVPNGFDVENLSPLPPFFSMGERVVSQLRTINIRAKMNTMERGVFYERLAPGPNRLKGLVVQFSGAPGDAAGRIRENAMCKGGFSGLCLPEVEAKMKQYDSSTDAQEREKVLNELQAYLLDNYYFIPLVRNVLAVAQGPRIANKPTDIMGAIPQYPFVGPYEDILIKD